jgi:hypothetical protein
MMDFLWRTAKRFAVLLPALIITYLSVRKVFPFFDRRVPDVLAIFITYVIAAYVLIPGLIRVYRIIRPPDHLPLYAVTPDGFASDPINVGVIATRRELITAMEKAGWYVADRHSPLNIVRLIIAILIGRPYPSAPVSNLYLFGRKQDIAFEIPIGGTPSARHHVRFWATTFDREKELNVRSIHWHHRREHVYSDNLLWVGAASLDVGISFIRHNFQLSHMIHPDTDQERELILQLLRAHGLVRKVEYVKLGEPYRLINRVMTGHLRSDGQMAVVSLKQPTKIKVGSSPSGKSPKTSRRQARSVTSS